MYWLDNNTGISTAPTPPAVISLTKKFFTNGGIGEPPSIPEDFWFNMVQEELLGILTLAGITPDKSDLNQVAKAIQFISFSVYPVGAPIPWPTAVPPAGFIAMTGQPFSATTYPKLALAYPALIIPDMRGEFIRGFDAGRGIDSGRAILSRQHGSPMVCDDDSAIADIAGITTAMGGLRPSLFDDPPSTTVAQLRVSYTQLNPGPPPGITVRTLGSGYGWIGISRPDNISFNYIVRAA